MAVKLALNQLTAKMLTGGPSIRDFCFHLTTSTFSEVCAGVLLFVTIIPAVTAERLGGLVILGPERLRSLVILGPEKLSGLVILGPERLSGLVILCMENEL